MDIYQINQVIIEGDLRVSDEAGVLTRVSIRIISNIVPNKIVIISDFDIR